MADKIERDCASITKDPRTTEEEKEEAREKKSLLLERLETQKESMDGRMPFGLVLSFSGRHQGLMASIDVVVVPTTSSTGTRLIVTGLAEPETVRQVEWILRFVRKVVSR